MAQAIKGSRRTPSPIWQYFEIVENNQAKCKHCQAILVRGKPTAAQKDLTNTCLWNHLQRKHKILYLEATKERTTANDLKAKEKL